MSDSYNPALDVIFYILASHGEPQRLDFACKLLEKIYRNGQNCYVLVDDNAQATMVDTQLWTFRAGSFVPHQIYKNQAPELPQTLLIGFADIPASHQQLIVNLSTQTPNYSQTTTRIVEIIDNSTGSKQAGRERYRHYQQRGISLQTHHIS